MQITLPDILRMIQLTNLPGSPGSPPPNAPGNGGLRIPDLTPAPAMSAAPAPALQAPEPGTDAGETAVAARVPYDFHGMFGLHGGLRDILGAVGDAFLRQGGGQAVYAPRHQMESEANAMRGFVDNPMAAMERLNRENPTAARAFYDSVQDNRRLDGVAARQEEDSVGRRQASADTIAASMFRHATAETWPRIREQAMRLYAARGLQPSLPIPEAFDENAIGTLVDSTITPHQANMEDETQSWHGALRDMSAANLGMRGRALAQNQNQFDRREARTEEEFGQMMGYRNDTLEERRDNHRAWLDYNLRYPSRSRRGMVGGASSIGRPVPSPSPTAPTTGQIRRRRDANGRVVQTQVFRNGQWVNQ